MSLILALEIFILIWIIVEVFTLSYEKKSLVGCVYGTTGRWMTTSVMIGLLAVTQLIHLNDNYNASKTTAISQQQSLF
jgi:hypothetical protein